MSDEIGFFDVVARSASLTEVGRELGVSVSSVSKRLARLEKRLGVRLVQRSTRRLTLTAEGERYAAGAATITAQLAELEESITGNYSELRGPIRVHSSVGLGRAHIGPLLAEFVDRNPLVQVDVELSAKPVVVAGAPVDIAIKVGTLRDSRLAAKTLHPNRRVVCASPEYLRNNGTPRTFKDLEQHNCIVLRQDEGDFALWRFGREGDETSVRVSGSLISNDGDVTTQWCVDGHGLLMRSMWHVAPLIEQGLLTHVFPDVDTPSADIHAVYSATPDPTRRVRAAVAYLRDGLAARLR
ncbi:LysR family transcriptional regulator [Rhodococcoides yunnanense]|uniref:LysR family transcriptional regulator n=1 Tax=Rhodococcoides yunnanense TaxID=278209 RepID=UPI000934BE9A|nr:LysR family transcriptional regulator [Rhodococcus yunnanensis]